MTGFAFYALGTPGPQGSKIRTKFAMRESSQKVGPWREAVKAAAPAHTVTLDGPLICRMIFTLRRPPSIRKADTMPYRTPDLSKLVRATEDAITDVGLWADDARVAEYARLAKVWWPHDGEALPVPGVVVACVPVEAENIECARADLTWMIEQQIAHATRTIRGEGATA